MNLTLDTGRYSDVIGLAQTHTSRLFKAYAQDLGQSVVLKFTAEERASHLIGRELAALRAINHPHVVHGINGSTEPIPHLVMEFIRGGVTLADIMRELPPIADAEVPVFNELLAAFIIRELADALLVVHNTGFIHGDTKPANILFNYRSMLKLVDFALTRSSSEPVHLDSDRRGYGTPEYSDPQQFAFFNPDNATPKQDLYPLGVILFELIFRQRRVIVPAGADRKAFAIETAQSDRFNAPCSGPNWVKSIIQRTARRDPKRRWNNAGDVLEFLDTNQIPALSRDEFGIYVAGLKTRIKNTNRRSPKLKPPSSWLTKLTGEQAE